MINFGKASCTKERYLHLTVAQKHMYKIKYNQTAGEVVEEIMPRSTKSDMHAMGKVLQLVKDEWRYYNQSDEAQEKQSVTKDNCLLPDYKRRPEAGQFLAEMKELMQSYKLNYNIS